MDPIPLRILLVEDNSGDAVLLRRALAQVSGYAIEVAHTQRLKPGLHRLAEESWDLLFLDLSLPDSVGLETVTRARQAAPQTALIVLTGLDDEATAIAALQEGAQDYLVKARYEPDLLGRAMRYAIERQRLQSALEHLSHVDALTGLFNVRGFTTVARQQLALAVREGRAGGLLFIDLDGLKRINDTAGHAAGDGALAAVAKLLRGVFRASDILGRLGGDEFAVWANHASAAHSKMIERRLAALIDDHNSSAGAGLPLSLSLGWAFLDPQAPATLESLLAAADAAMYQHKQQQAGNLQAVGGGAAPQRLFG